MTLIFHRSSSTDEQRKVTKFIFMVFSLLRVPQGQNYLYKKRRRKSLFYFSNLEQEFVRHIIREVLQSLISNF